MTFTFISHPIRLGFLSSLLLLVSNSYAAPVPVYKAQQDYLAALRLDEEQDWLQLYSGEILQGSLKELYAEVIEFKSNDLGTIYIDLEDVRRLRSADTFQVNLRDLGVHRGRLRLDDEWLSINTEKEIRVERTQIVTIYTIATRERDRWDNKVTLSANLSSGNSDTIEVNGKLSSERKTATNRTNIDYLGVLTESNSETTARNHRLTLSHDIYKNNRLFLRPILSDLFHAPLQNIDLQTQLSSQIGYVFVDDDKKHWELTVGPSWKKTRFINVQEGSDSQQSWGGAFSSKFAIDINERIELEHDYAMTFSEKKTGGYQHHNVLSLSIELTDIMDLDVDFIWDYTHTPTPDAENITPEQSDYRLVFGLGIEF